MDIEKVETANIQRISALGLFRFGYSYLVAGNLLLKSGGDITLYPRLFMYAHAIELGLKAYIFEKKNELVYNHKLEEHLIAASGCGLVFTDTFQSIVRTFNVLNKDEHRMRYFKTGPLFFPNNDVLLLETNNFYESLQNSIRHADRVVRKHKSVAH